MRYQLHFVLLLLSFFSINYGCPFIITNDSNQKVIIVDPYNKQAIHINPGEKREIDPSISGWRYYFYHEKLDVYVPKQNMPHLFYRQYQLQEKYCINGKTELSFSQIAEFVTKPIERFEAFEFKPHEYAGHTH